MRRDIRNEILKTAKELFNEQGFNTVSTRDIAEALGISKGNLTYYFKRKEEIVEAILAGNPNTPPLEPPKNLEELNAFFLDIQHVVRENAFYFWHHAQLSQLSPRIRDQQHAIYLSNAEKLTHAFRTFRAASLIREENFTGEYDRVIDTLLLSGIYWMPFCELTRKHGSRENFQHHAWAAVYPLLTDKGREALRGIAGM